MENFKNVDKELIESFNVFLSSLKNMDIETRETKIQSMVEALAEGSRLELKKALKEAYRKKLMTQEEYERDWKGRYFDEDVGIDGFATVLYAYVFAPKEKDKLVIVSTCRKLLADAERVKKRFNIMVKSPKQVVELIKEKDPEGYKAVMKRMKNNS